MDSNPLSRVIAFDLDNTLARSKQPIEADMAALLARLLARTDVAVTSGGMLSQLTSQVADQLPADANRANLYLLPTSGAALYEWRVAAGSDDAADSAAEGGAWQQVYEERLTDDEQAQVKAAIEESARQTGVVDFGTPAHGELIELRGAQVTLSALGQRAPVDEKVAWDPTHAKREALRAAIAPLLPEYDVKIGGSTSIDVTKRGVNKAYGIRKLSELLSIPIADMLYVGDELSPGGNDEVVKETGIPTHAVSGPDDTARLLESLLG